MVNKVTIIGFKAGDRIAPIAPPLWICPWFFCALVRISLLKTLDTICVLSAVDLLNVAN